MLLQQAFNKKKFNILFFDLIDKPGQKRTRVDSASTAVKKLKTKPEKEKKGIPI